MEKENNGKGATTADVFWLCNLISNRTQLMASNGERFALKSRVYTGRIMVDLVCVQEKKTNNRRQREKEVESQTAAAAMATGSPFANFWGKPRRIKSKRDSDPAVERTRYHTLTTLLRSGPDLYLFTHFLTT
jgi:hypothetical protein